MMAPEASPPAPAARARRALIPAVILMLSLVTPATHLWIRYCPPPDCAPTGIHTGDSAHHLLCMRSFHNGFHSPFATCRAPHGAEYPGYFATPFFLMYGLLGAVGRIFSWDDFLYLGALNGLGGALYLLAAWRLLRRIDPRHGDTAFMLFALGGGLGGAAYAASGLAGWHAHPAFDRLFQRFAWYELIEGQHLSPLLLMPRLYYTLPMAAALSAIAMLAHQNTHTAAPGARRTALACALAAFAAFLNLRLGPMLWVVIMLYLALAAPWPRAARLRLALTCSGAIAAGCAGAWAVMRQHPVYLDNAAQITQQVMRLMPFLSASGLFWLAASPALRATLCQMDGVARSASFALAGYLGFYAFLYLGHQAYYGNWLHGGDTSAAVAVSDCALIGAALGLAAAWAMREQRASNNTAGSAWVLLWLLTFTAAGLSALGGGWMLRFTPERCIVWIGLPLALFAAQGTARMSARMRRTARGGIIGCGVLSLAAASLFFQGPLGRVPGEGPFAYLHYAHMSPHDADLLNALPDGIIAVPLWSPIAFGEIVSLRPGKQVLGGPGNMNLGDQPFGTVEADVDVFFAPDTGVARRAAFLDDWRVEYVYCPDTCPVSAETLAAFSAWPRLEEIARANRGRIYRVIPGG